MQSTSTGRSRLTLPRGCELFRIETLGMRVISPRYPTYWPTDRNKISDLIDFCLAKEISENYFECMGCPELSSDHSPVLVTLASKILIKPKKCMLHNGKTD